MKIENPYYAVIFTNTRTDIEDGYSKMAEQMEELARTQPGFLDFESARDGLGISVSYWKTLADITNWKASTDHMFAQKKGMSDWYSWYKVRICVVEREYEFKR